MNEYNRNQKKKENNLKFSNRSNPTLRIVFVWSQEIKSRSNLLNSLNTEIFSQKNVKKHGKTNKLSQPIVFLAVIGIALGIAVMLISSAVATGFQKEIREKVVGFGGHIQIESQFGNESYESNPMLIPYNLKDELEKDSKVRLTQNYAYKPAILQSKK